MGLSNAGKPDSRWLSVRILSSGQEKCKPNNQSDFFLFGLGEDASNNHRLQTSAAVLVLLSDRFILDKPKGHDKDL